MSAVYIGGCSNCRSPLPLKVKFLEQIGCGGGIIRGKKKSHSAALIKIIKIPSEENHSNEHQTSLYLLFRFHHQNIDLRPFCT